MNKLSVLFSEAVKIHVIGRILFLLIFPGLFYGCDSEDAPDCFRNPGEIISKEVYTDTFREVIVHGRIKLFIEQGEEQKLIIESGRNLIEGISAEVENGRLSLKSLNNCTFFRERHITTIYLTVPNLTWVMNASNKTVESIGVLEFPEIRLRSNNNQHDPEIYTNGDFRLHLVSDRILLDGDDFSNFYLSGTTDFLNASFWAGDGRLEAGDLKANTVFIFHRGTNKMIVNPQEILEGEIRSTGDVISVNRPPVVKVETFYTGKLIFQ